MRPEAKVRRRGDRSAPDFSWLFASSAMYVASLTGMTREKRNHIRHHQPQKPTVRESGVAPRRHEVRACYEASGAGYVLERMIRGWGHACEIVAPSLIPRRPGEQRKHDRKDAEELARLYRAGELVTIRVPTEREERVRDVVRCRGVSQREILKSRHYILKFLARRGLVYREGRNWTGRHMMWLRAIQRDAVLETEDQVVFGEYPALLDY